MEPVIFLCLLPKECIMSGIVVYKASLRDTAADEAALCLSHVKMSQVWAACIQLL